VVLEPNLQCKGGTNKKQGVEKLGCLIWVFPKIGVFAKMDGENYGKPYEQMDDLGGKPTIFGNTHVKIWFIYPIETTIYSS